MTVSETSFDRRDVRYEDIHAIRDEDFDAMVRMARIEDGLRILDCGCGYGACTREILKRLGPKQSIEIDLLDRSAPQLNRSVGELADWENDPRVTLRRIHGEFPRDLPPGVRYDRIFAKMMLHESPADVQPLLLQAMRDHLRPDGLLVVWELFLTSSTADFFRQVIRWKDELVGNDTFVRDRYLATRDELNTWLRSASLSVLDEPHIVTYTIDTARRLMADFRGDGKACQQWVSRIRATAGTLPLSVQQELRLNDDGTSIQCRVTKAVIVAERSATPNTMASRHIDLSASSNAIAHRHIDLPPLSTDIGDADKFQQDLFARLVAAFLPEILPASTHALVRGSLVRPGGADKPHAKFVKGLDYVFRIANVPETLTKQFASFLAYVTTAYVAGKDNPKVGIGGALSAMLADFTGTAIIRMNLKPGDKSAHSLVVTVDAPPKLQQVRCEMGVPRDVMTAFADVATLIRDAGVLPNASPPHGEFARLSILLPGESDSLCVDDAAVMLPSQIEGANLLISRLTEPLEWSIQQTSDTSDPLYRLRLESFLNHIPARALAGYLFHSGTPHAVYICPSTMLLMQGTKEERRIEEGTFGVLSSEHLDGAAVESLKMLSLRLWTGLSQHHVASLAGRVSHVRAYQRLGHALKTCTELPSWQQLGATLRKSASSESMNGVSSLLNDAADMTLLFGFAHGLGGLLRLDSILDQPDDPAVSKKLNDWIDSDAMRRINDGDMADIAADYACLLAYLVAGVCKRYNLSRAVLEYSDEWGKDDREEILSGGQESALVAEARKRIANGQTALPPFTYESNAIYLIGPILIEPLCNAARYLARHSKEAESHPLIVGLRTRRADGGGFEIDVDVRNALFEVTDARSTGVFDTQKLVEKLALATFHFSGVDPDRNASKQEWVTSLTLTPWRLASRLAKGGSQ